MDISSALEAWKLIWSYFGHLIGYVINPEKKMEELNEQAGYLFAKRDDVEAMISRVPPNAATRESELWLADVKKVERDVKSIQAAHTRGPNFFSRMDLGKRVGAVMDKITDLNNKRPKLKGKEFSIAPLEKVQRQNVEANSSAAAEHTLQKVLGFVEDDKIRRTGIWGMGGVGKTTVMKLLNNRPEVSQRFEIIIWITVSRGDERKVQNAIAERLKLTKSESNDELKASIREALSRKRFLLLLDDVWNLIDLSDVGIPLEHQVNGSKIVLTTRSLDVCRQMKTDEEVKVETLSKDEAWTLFTENVGDVAMTPSIEQFARDIVAQCDGLPLAIIVVGSSLRKIKDVVVWRNTLRELQSPTTSQIKAMEERVFCCLRYSYERLQDECKMKLFLYCSLYPEDYMIKINELVEHCWLEGYIHGVDSIQDARDKGHTMVMNLVDASLLEKGHEGYVKMHDIIRDFAMKEASGFLIKTGKHVRQPPMKNEWHVRQPPMKNEWLQWEKMSMMECSLQGLSESWNCSIMSTLLLQGSAELTMISDSFFEKMTSLSILDLTGTNIESLPLSLFNLVKLCGLYLRHCVKLKELPAQVGQLKQLEVLHLGDGTQINCLPREVGELSCLKRLIVGFISIYSSFDTEEGNYMKMRFPTGIIPNLSLLEEVGIYADNCSEKDQWDDESMEIEIDDDESIEVVIGELCRLERLTSLDFYFPNAECLMHFVNERKLRKASCLSRFRFQVGPWLGHFKGFFENLEHEEWEKCLAYTCGDEISHGAIMETLAHCSLFHLKYHSTSQKLSVFGMTNMNGLRKCWIMDCGKMELLLDGNEEQQTCAILPNLEVLKITELPNLRSLWVGPLLPGSLCKLTRLDLDNCEKMEVLFTRNEEQQTCAILPNLEVLNIWNLPNLRSLWVGPLLPGSLCKLTRLDLYSCEKMEVLFYGNEEQQTCAILPNLEELYIWKLPNLRSLWVGPLLPESLWKLNWLHLDSCEKMEVLFYGNEEEQKCAILPNLEVLNIRKLPNLRSLWVGLLFPGSLSKLTKLRLQSCGSHRLKKVFQLAMIQQLTNLAILDICDSSIEEIIGNEDETSVPCPTHISSNGTIILPNIKWIFLCDLPELVSICRGVSLEWPSLEAIYISDCPKLRSLSSIIHGNNNVPPVLEEIKAPSSWWEALEWEENDIKQ